MSFIHRDRDRISEMNGDRSDKWGEDVDVCLFNCNAGICAWSNWRNDERSYERSSDIYVPHTQNSLDLILDLNALTLSYYSNQTFRRLLKNGLEGKYVWFLSLRSSPLNTSPFHIKCSAF